MKYDTSLGAMSVKAKTANTVNSTKFYLSIFFYPPAQHAYQCSICGRACDTARYMHLEEKGVLNKKFNHPFRTREEWKFKLKDFELNPLPKSN